MKDCSFAPVLSQLSPPPANSQAWLLAQLNAHNPNNRGEVTEFSVARCESLVGMCLDSKREQTRQKQSATALLEVVSVEGQPNTQQTAPAERIREVASNVANQTIQTPNYKPTQTLDMTSVGLREARSDADLQGSADQRLWTYKSQSGHPENGGTCLRHTLPG